MAQNISLVNELPDQSPTEAKGPGSVSSSKGGELGRYPAIPSRTNRSPTLHVPRTTPLDITSDLMDLGSKRQPQPHRLPGTAAPPNQCKPSTDIPIKRSNRLPRRQVHPAGIHSILAPSSWSRYVSIRPDEGTQICALGTYRSLKARFPQDTPNFHIADNRMEAIVHASSESHSRDLLNLKSLGDIPVTSTDKNDFNKRVCTVLVHQFLPGPSATDDFIAETIGQVLPTKVIRLIKFTSLRRNPPGLKVPLSWLSSLSISKHFPLLSSLPDRASGFRKSFLPPSIVTYALGLVTPLRCAGL